ncbi:MAG TPA: hypothetical protein VGU23_10065, partial [Acidobacteriaceae bacterium]|nr:hypothetical protein [Acidobacteriaceae bacterium]
DPGIDAAGVFFAYKFLWIFIAAGLYYQFRKNVRGALFCLSGLALAIGSMYIGIDYTRLMGFATIALIVCYAESAKQMSKGFFRTVVVLNLLLPSIFVTGLGRLATFRGLYEFGARWLIGLIDPRI